MAAPQQPDFFQAAQSLLGQNSGPSSFIATNAPANSGLGTRQSQIPNNRPGVSTRNMIRWLIPDGPVVEMYINPQNITYNENKTINSARTKGGYVLQYWGPELIKLNISGTTGTSGIEGINVLKDIYNAEQLAFDPYALLLQAKIEQEKFNQGIFGNSNILSAGSNVLGALINGASNGLPTQVPDYPTLASLAFGIEMYWSGEVYRGFFNSFTVRESADHLGLFDYDISFTATQKRGLRLNFLAWHRSAVSGPSNSNPVFGTPHSYGPLVTQTPTPKPV